MATLGEIVATNVGDVERRPARRRGAPTEIVPVLSFDPGPSMRQKRDGTLVSRGPGAVTLEYREDLDADANTIGDRPVIRGARRTSSVDELRARRTIDERRHRAAVRFLDDCSLASGGGMVADPLASRGCGVPSAGLPEVQVDAQGRVRDSLQAVGLIAGPVFQCVVFDNGSLDKYDAAAKRRKGTGAGLLRDALDRLADLQATWDDRASE